MRVEIPSLLITDDDPDFRQTLCGVFDRRGFHTLTASDGAEALDIVEREQIHLLLLDMHMPRLTGLETLRRVRQLQLAVPCILMSGQMDDVLAEAARAENAFTVLRKPVRFLEINRAVDSALKTIYGWPD
jgi:CheY-like chemotaxis protein